ncbi:MAG: hypothetical protein LBN08_07195 [Lactobacillales bacterium]|nr:hypothetical protein [Lactobacillales bacterium]
MGIKIHESDLSRLENSNHSIGMARLSAALYVMNYSISDFFRDENNTEIARLLANIISAIEDNDFDKYEIIKNVNLEIFSDPLKELTLAMVETIYAVNEKQEVSQNARVFLNEFFYLNRQYIRLEYLILSNCVSALDYDTIEDQINFLLKFFFEEATSLSRRNLVIQTIANLLVAKLHLGKTQRVKETIDQLIPVAADNDLPLLTKLWTIRGITYLQTECTMEAMADFANVKMMLRNLKREKMLKEFSAWIDAVHHDFLEGKQTNSLAWLKIYIPE